MSKAKRAANHKKLGKYTSTPKKIVARQQKKRAEKIATLNAEISAEKRQTIRRNYRRKCFTLEEAARRSYSICELLSERNWFLANEPKLLEIFKSR